MVGRAERGTTIVVVPVAVVALLGIGETPIAAVEGTVERATVVGRLIAVVAFLARHDAGVAALGCSNGEGRFDKPIATEDVALSDAAPRTPVAADDVAVVALLSGLPRAVTAARHLTTVVARIPVRQVPVVALLAVAEGAVAAAVDQAMSRTTVTLGDVAVITRLELIADAVTTSLAGGAEGTAGIVAINKVIVIVVDAIVTLLPSVASRGGEAGAEYDW